MADMDLSGGYGAGGAIQGLQDILKQRYLAAQPAQQGGLPQQELTERNRSNLAHEAIQQQQLAENAATREADRQERIRNHQEVEAIRRTQSGERVANDLPGGSFLSQTDPSVGLLQTTGYGSLLTPTP